MIVSDIAIILHGRKFSDTSKILTVYSQHHGKISLLAKGVRTAKSAMGGNVEALRCSSISWYQYPNKDLHLLKSAENAIPLYHLTSDYDKLIAAMCISEIISSTQETEEANPELFDLCLQTLQMLNIELAADRSFSYVLCFLFYLAKIMGFALHVDNCPITGDTIIPEESEQFFLSFNEGSILSHSIPHNGKMGLLLNSSIVSILQKIALLNAEEFGSVSVSIADQLTMLDMFQRYFSFHSHKSFRWKSLPSGF